VLGPLQGEGRTNVSTKDDKATRTTYNIPCGPRSTICMGPKVFKSLGCSQGDKFTYKMRSGGKLDLGSGTRPAQSS
jgi:hypothetical protein